ncbi:hypothetical protein BDR07DRAFT_1426170 [Suillus spraguei]|nr:hypothetical protein BDR07DRAFT_1426170 [Suillus spraguei]
MKVAVKPSFVGLREDSQVLTARAPDLFELAAHEGGAIALTYPRVVQGVPRV